MQSLNLIVLVMALVIPSVVRADEGAVTLQDLEQEALRNNPEIKMAVKKTEAARERSSAASGLPDPMIGYEYKNVGSLTKSTIGTEEMSMSGIVVSQEIPFPGKLSTMGRSAVKAAEQLQENERDTRLRVLSSLRNAYYEYYLAYRSSEILEENKEVMKSFQRIAETRYATGQGIQQDVLRAQLEVSMMLDRIAEEERKKEVQAGVINALAGRDPLAPLSRPADVVKATLDVSLDEISSRSLAHSPQIKAKERMVEQGEEELSLSKRQYLPDMVVSAGRFDRKDLTPVWEASVMFKVPLYFWNKASGVSAASAELGAARHDQDAVKLGVLSRVRELYAMARTAEHHLHLYEAGILPQAEMALRSAASSYQVGKVDFQALLDAEGLLLKYRLTYQEELVNLSKTLAMLRETMGEEHE